MPRILDSEQNVITLRDTVCGDQVQFFYRIPLPSEIQAYASASIMRKGGKIVINAVDPKIKYGLDILTGVREGDFIYGGKPLSSDPKSPNFREDWKAILKEKAPDLIIFFAAQVFDGSRVVETEIESGEALEDAIPFPKS